MTDSVARQQLPVPLAYRRADRAQVLAKLIHNLIYGGDPESSLSTRELTDPTVALLNSWARIADVVDFYQERIASESYLHTAIEPESVLALAALLGYRPRPGLAATCWLAYTLVPDATDTAVLVPKGQMIQSIPATGELPQTFATAEDLVARPSWNTLPMKTTRPVQLVIGDANAQTYRMPEQLTVVGALPPLSANDVVLIIPTQSLQFEQDCLVLRAASVSSDVPTSTTTVTLQQQNSDQVVRARLQTPSSLLEAMDNLISPLARRPSKPPKTATDIQRSPSAIFPGQADAELNDVSAKVLSVLQPGLSSALYPALASSKIGTSQVDAVHALRATTLPFGVQIPPRPRFDNQGQPLTPQEWPLNANQTIRISIIADGRKFDENIVLPRFQATALRFDAASYHDALVLNGDATLPSGAGDIKLSRTQADPAAPIAAPAPTFNRVEFIPADKTSLDDVIVTFNEENNRAPEVTVEAPGIGDDKVTVGIDITGTTTSGASGAIYVTASIPPRFSPDDHRWLVIEVITALAVPANQLNILELNERRDDIVAGSYVMIEDGLNAAVSTVAPLNPSIEASHEVSYPVVTQVKSASPAVVNRYGMSMTVTRLTLTSDWIDGKKRLLSDVRPLVVRALSARLDLLEEPWNDPVTGGTIDVNGLHPGLETGHRLVITGVRADPDLGDATVQAGEAIMVAGVNAPGDPSHAGETPYTTLTLATPLSYSYRRKTVTLYGNVVPAHHGPPITETLTAAGDPANPVFTLAQAPVLADPSSTQAGYASSLVLVIDGRTWTWVPRLDNDTPARCYITGTDSQGHTTITLGQPLPHLGSTVTASYRAGIGSAGNLRAGQLTQPLTRPLAVAKVTNPLPASGGADPDGPDDVRTGAPRGLQALGRVVSVQDAADIALGWAGIGKATAILASDGNRDVLTVAVAGVSPMPLSRTSTLVTDLSSALKAAGEIAVPITVVPAQVTLIVLNVQIRHDPDLAWDTIEPAVRATLTEAYGYQHRNINEDIVISDLIAIVHRVDGVRSCTISHIGQIPYDSAASDVAKLVLYRPEYPRIPVQSSALASEQTPVAPVPAIGYISATIPDTLILQEVNDDHG